MSKERLLTKHQREELYKIHEGFNYSRHYYQYLDEKKCIDKKYKEDILSLRKIYHKNILLNSSQLSERKVFKENKSIFDKEYDKDLIKSEMKYRKLHTESKKQLKNTLKSKRWKNIGYGEGKSFP